MQRDPVNKLEAVLFIYGEPLETKKIAKLLDIETEAVPGLIEELKTKLESTGLSLVSLSDKVQLVTRPEYGSLLESIVKEELSEELTSASLETLAIISYLGPVSRSKIDYIRGVNSTFILRSLLLRGLVTRFTDPHRANAFLYQASFEFARHLGLEKLENLPEFQKYREMLGKINPAPSDEK